MRKNSFGLIALCFAIILLLTGCGSKTALTTNEFKSKAENKGYAIYDVMSQYAGFNFIKEATVARSDDWQIEFYVLSDEANATSMFETNKQTFETFKGNSATESSSNVNNYSTYSLTSNGYYMYLCRVDNTLLYAKVSEKNKDTVKDFIKELKY